MGERSKRKSSLARENERLRKRIASLETGRRDLYRAEQALAQYWCLLDAILSGTDDLYGLKGLDYSYQAANQALCQFAGLPEKDMRGRGDFELFPRPLAEILHRDDADVLQRVETSVREVKLDLRQRPLWVRIQKSPVLDNEGACVGILCVIRDHSLLHRLQSQQRLFTRGGHDGYWCTSLDGHLLDVNNAYCVSTGYARQELLGRNLRELEWMPTPEKVSVPFETIARVGYGTYRALHRSKDKRILEFEVNVIYTPEDRGRFYHFFREPLTSVPMELPPAPMPEHVSPVRPNFRVLNLNDIVVLAISQEIDKIPPGISIRKDLEAQLRNTLANQSQMLQIVINLLVNAVEAMEGRGHIRIVTRNVELTREWLGSNPKYQPGHYCYLAISDTGKGIGPGLLEKIFEPFITTKFKGRGMGLASVSRNVEEHNGIVTVKSEEGRGSTFNIYLPATDSQIERRETLPQIPSGTETILFVDSEARVLEAGRTMLERLAYRVILTENIDEALRHVKSHYPPVDVVVLDTAASRESHSAFIEHLLQINPQIKVILAGNHGLDAWSQDLLDSGAHGFVQKPFRPEVLAPKIRQTLDT